MRELTYGWNLEMQMRVARAGLRVLEVPVGYRRRIGGESKVAGSLRGSVKAGLKIMSTFARVAVEPRARAFVGFLHRDFAEKSVDAAAQLSAAFSTAFDAVSTVSAELCISVMAPETRCSTATTDFVPDAAAATLSEISRSRRSAARPRLRSPR